MRSDLLELNAELNRLATKVELLIAERTLLRKENASLREQLRRRDAESAHLEEKAALAQSRVEAMIARLKSMGYET